MMDKQHYTILILSKTQTSSIDPTLDFAWNFNISDLTGIEDFSSLVYLNCNGNWNNSNSLNSRRNHNTALEYLSCETIF